jgi:hypothetical protein
MSTTAYDLDSIGIQGGLINEDVMQKIWEIDNIPLPLTMRIGSDSHDNPYAEWTTEELAAPSTANKVIDGADTTGDDTKEGTREGNQSQMSVKQVKISTRAQSVNTIGYANALTHQVSQRQKELRRDVEAQMLTAQASVKMTDAAAGVSGGLAAWITDETAQANGTTEGGFDIATSLVDARTGYNTLPLAITEEDVRAVSTLVYEAGGESSVLMSTVSVCNAFSQYLFTSSARVAALQSDVNQSKSAVTATGAVNVFVADNATLELVGNRLQQPEAGDAVSAFLLDTSMLRLSFLKGYQVQPLAKTGTADERLMCVDYTLKVLNSKAQGLIANVDQTAAALAVPA